MDDVEMLNHLYDRLNKYLFEKRLPPVLIRLYNKRGTWNVIRDKGNFQITICLKALSIPEEQIYINMLHQMIHIYNQIQDITDVSQAGRYHNKHWNAKAQQVGLITTFEPTKGFKATGIDPKTIELAKWFFNYEKYLEEVNRDLRARKQGVFAKFQCPACDRVIFARNGSREIICNYCHRNFIQIKGK